MREGVIGPSALAGGPAQLMPASAWGRHCVFAFDVTLFLALHVMWRCSCMALLPSFCCSLGSVSVLMLWTCCLPLDWSDWGVCWGPAELQ